MKVHNIKVHYSYIIAEATPWMPLVLLNCNEHCYIYMDLWTKNDKLQLKCPKNHIIHNVHSSGRIRSKKTQICKYLLSIKGTVS